MVWRIFVYILLGLGVLGVLAKSWSIVVILAHLPTNWLISPSQNPFLDIISTVVYAAALYGIWRWKKWGAYLIFVRLAFTMSLQIFVYHSLGWQLAVGYTGTENLLADLSGAGLWLVAFLFTWKHFR